MLTLSKQDTFHKNYQSLRNTFSRYVCNMIVVWDLIWDIFSNGMYLCSTNAPYLALKARQLHTIKEEKDMWERRSKRGQHFCLQNCCKVVARARLACQMATPKVPKPWWSRPRNESSQQKFWESGETTARLQQPVQIANQLNSVKKLQNCKLEHVYTI